MRLGLGVGLDLPWRGPYGIAGDRVCERTVRFLQRYARDFAYQFVSWQPPHKGTPDAADVFPILDDLFGRVPAVPRALHQTALNLAGTAYDRRAFVALTNALIERYDLLWVNEDLGLWSVAGLPLPYPQPPPLSEAGVQRCARTCAEVDRALIAPLVVEFPGFEVPAPWIHGPLDAYDAFRSIVEEADVLCNLDTGHLLTWRWLQGHRGEQLLGDLDRLPLDRCVEIHCAGATKHGDRLIDAHHGVLLDLQLALVERLMQRCPSLRVITYEDPRFDEDGVLPAPAEASLAALRRLTDAWVREETEGPGVAPAPIRSPRVPTPERRAARPDSPWERELHAAFLADDGFGRRCRRQLITRPTRGLGAVTGLYPEAVAAWRDVHPEDTDLDALLGAFLRSDPGRSLSEFAWATPGRCIEDAFGAFLAPGSAEHRTACAKILLLHPDPPFDPPEGFVRVPEGWWAIGAGPHLYAAIAGKLVCGPITDRIVSLLRGERPPGCDPVLASLQRMGLIA